MEKMSHFFQTTGICRHGDPLFFFENVSNLMDGAYVIEVKQYHQEFTLNILEISEQQPTLADCSCSKNMLTVFSLRAFSF